MNRSIFPTLQLAALTTFFALATAGLAADDTGRFTRSLNAAERSQAGIDRLTSDQAAVLDALVRRDSASRVSVPPAQQQPPADSKAAAKAEPLPTPSSFSKRLTAEERRLAGFGSLTAGEMARLDALIERFTSASVARALLAPPRYISRYSRVEPAEREERRKIHGSYSLSFGWGKDGYSERTGAMQMTYDDPAGRYSVTIGYAESHVKGGPGYGVYRDGPPYLDRRPYPEP